MDLSERQKLFENPTAEYRGKPFWSWNGRLEEAELCRQIDIIKEMGFGGYFMHSRTGLETEYLGEEWFELTNKCADYGYGKGMEAWLYDEDRWPSGSAGGMVTKEEKYRAMYMEMNFLTEDMWRSWQPDENVVAVFALKGDFPQFDGERESLTEKVNPSDSEAKSLTGAEEQSGSERESLTKTCPSGKNGIFRAKRLLHAGDVLASDETAVEFRVRTSVCTDNYNGYCYVNTMNREATRKYIELTHEKYKEKCGERFGKEIYGVFTDEPHRGGVFTNFAEAEVNAVPYTQDLFEEFEKRFGYSLKERLPELFLRTQEAELSKVTRDYFELCQELFLERFAIPVYDWCKQNKLIFTGHVLHEDSLACQAVMQGSLMRFYEYMDYPGIDILSEGNRCYWVAKQISSVARQLDKEWVLSELYGCTGWQMDFEDYKNVGDWQALFGVNLRCPHLSWYTMKGEAKRDYPASILHQSGWYQDYRYVEDYFSRIHAVLHGGKPACELLVINPIESVWARAYSGAFDGLAAADGEMKRLEAQYASLFHMLAGNRIDFDYGEEDILARHGRVEDCVLYVGKAAYRKVLVAGMDTMRRSTLHLLETFAAQGGEVIFAGEVPGYMDVEPSEEPGKLAETCIRINFTEQEVARACRSGHEVGIVRTGDGGQKENTENQDLFAQAFEIEGGRVIMVLNVNRVQGYNGITLDLGEGSCLEAWEARSGRVTEPQYRVEDGRILITIDLEKGGERLYIIPDSKRELPGAEAFSGQEKVALPDSFSYRLSERNICVLDMVSVTDSQGREFPCMEVLKADRALRDQLGIPYRGGEMLQPWYQVKYKGGNTKLLDIVCLRYEVNIEEMLGSFQAGDTCSGSRSSQSSGNGHFAWKIHTPVRLAMEALEHVRSVTVNGVQVPAVSSGKWIDICFDELEIPADCLRPGGNTIDIEMAYYGTSGIEAVYLLGDFGVKVQGDSAILTALPDRLAIGDITGQGLPFYSGSVVYETEEIEGLSGASVAVTVEDFGGSLVKLLGDGEGVIAFPPYQARIGNLRGIEVVLTRRNTFGPLHQFPREAPSYGPGNFVTEGEGWSRDYMLYPQGLLEKPVIYRDSVC